MAEMGRLMIKKNRNRAPSDLSSLKYRSMPWPNSTWNGLISLMPSTPVSVQHTGNRSSFFPTSRYGCYLCFSNRILEWLSSLLAASYSKSCKLLHWLRILKFFLDKIDGRNLAPGSPTLPYLTFFISYSCTISSISRQKLAFVRRRIRWNFFDKSGFSA